jgi:hypothetical protein
VKKKKQNRPDQKEIEDPRRKRRSGGDQTHLEKTKRSREDRSKKIR